MALIEVKNIVKKYQVGNMEVPVLHGVSFSIKKGEYVALMGSSGSGKSTLMNILGCLDKQISGEYFLNGEEVSKLSGDARARLRNEQIGFVFQSFNLLRRTSAIENVLMPLTYSPEVLSDEEAVHRAKTLLGRVGLGERLDHEPSQLSGGQQQRVAIARALINNPSLLLADEPTGNLDSRTTEEVLQMFHELHTEGITILLVTHENEVAAHAKRVIRLRDGKVESDTMQETSSVIESVQ